MIQENASVFGNGNGMSKLMTPGDLAPDFELEDVQGKHIHLSDYRGRIVLLAFLRGFM